MGLSIGQRLNPGSGEGEPGSSDKIEVDAAVLKRISGAAGEVREGVARDGLYAEDESNAAGGALKSESFDLGGALAKAFQIWESQIDTLALACEQIEHSLAAAADGYERIDAENEKTMAEIAEYFE